MLFIVISAVGDRIGEDLGSIIEVKKEQLDKFGLKQSVLFADILWEKLLAAGKKQKIEYREIARYPSVHRDLSIIVDKDDYYFYKLSKFVIFINI